MYVIILTEWFGYDRFGHQTETPIEVNVDYLDGILNFMLVSQKTSDKITRTISLDSQELIEESLKITDNYIRKTSYLYFENEEECDETFKKLTEYMEDNNDEPYFLR